MFKISDMILEVAVYGMCKEFGIFGGKHTKTIFTDIFPSREFEVNHVN